ncbi:hypothetical protein JWG44_09795 [Leptospira sp. 201903071]|nr:hypothetical protein [Leptospira ainazelensis]MBM9500539.1 hypothetical protein [Leptospira ainazelensis]
MKRIFSEIVKTLYEQGSNGFVGKGFDLTNGSVRERIPPVHQTIEFGVRF